LPEESLAPLFVTPEYQDKNYKKSRLALLARILLI